MFLPIQFSSDNSTVKVLNNSAKQTKQNKNSSRKMGMFLKLVLVSVLFSLGTIECNRPRNQTSTPKIRKIKRDYGYNNNLDNNHNSNYYEYQQDHYRVDKDKDQNSLALPHGTKISFTPAISIPISNDGDDKSPARVTTSFDVAVPIIVTFQKMKDMMPAKPFQKTGFWEGFNSVTSDAAASNEVVIDQHRLLSRKLRDVNWAYHHNQTSSRTSRRCQSKSFIDRRTILQKMEVFASSLLETESEKPKECLLRWACELHENSEVAGYYGLLGEAVMLILSVQELSHGCDATNPHLKYLGPFVKAELAGKARKCDIFRKKCSQSIFAK